MRFYAKEIVESGQIGKNVLIPNTEGNVSVGVVPDSGAAGKIQVSISHINDVNNNSASWYDWPSGAVSTPTMDVLLGEVTAIRVVSISGRVVMEISG